jgi:hypothetical protein
MQIFGKVVERGEDDFVLKTQIAPGMIEDIELGEFLEEFEDQEVIITINAVKKRKYSKDDQFTEGGALSE